MDIFILSSHMYRFCYLSIITFLISISSFSFAQLSTIDSTSPSITQSIDQVVDTSTITSPIRQGTLFGIQSPDGNHKLNVMNVGSILGFDQAENATLSLIHNIINILLSFITLIILILLIIEGYKIVTAGTNIDQYKKAFGKLKNYAIAIAGIVLSRIIISFIFYILGSIIF